MHKSPSMKALIQNFSSIRFINYSMSPFCKGFLHVSCFQLTYVDLDLVHQILSLGAQQQNQCFSPSQMKILVAMSLSGEFLLHRQDESSSMILQEPQAQVFHSQSGGIGCILVWEHPTIHFKIFGCCSLSVTGSLIPLTTQNFVCTCSRSVLWGSDVGSDGTIKKKFIHACSSSERPCPW